MNEGIYDASVYLRHFRFMT